MWTLRRSVDNGVWGFKWFPLMSDRCCSPPGLYRDQRSHPGSWAGPRIHWYAVTTAKDRLTEMGTGKSLGRRSRGFRCPGPLDSSNQSLKHNLSAAICNKKKIWMDLITCTQTTMAENIGPQTDHLRFHEVQDRGIFGVPDHLIVATNVQNFIFRTISCTRKKSESIRCLELRESCRGKKILFFPRLVRTWNLLL